MAVDRTHISWAESTWNPLRGCRHVSRGCAHCYAERIAARFSGPGQPYEGLATWHHGMPRWTGQVRLVEAVLEQPARWTTGRRIFVNSQSDLFYGGVADSDIHRIWEQMRSTPYQTFLVLMKRPERMWQWIEDWRWNRLPNSSPGRVYSMPRHIWLGVSCEDQATANARILWLLKTPAVRFLSLEPLLGPIDLGRAIPCGYDCDEALGHVDHPFWTPHYFQRAPIHWVIAGGESGPGFRPMNLAWLAAIVAQCQEADVPVFVKQDAAVRPGQQGCIPERLWQCKAVPSGPPAGDL